MLAEKCYINCDFQDIYFVFNDIKTREITELDYNDFKAVDIITVI